MSSSLPSNPPFPSNVPTAPQVFIDYKLLVARDPNEIARLLSVSQGLGFFYLFNSDIDPEFMFSLGDQIFSLPLHELMKYDHRPTGTYFGYKAAGSQFTDSKGKPDYTQYYNISKNDLFELTPHRLAHPAPVNTPSTREYLKRFIKDSHNAAVVIMECLATALGLPADAFSSRHDFCTLSGDIARTISSSNPPPEDDNAVLIGEHTDFGSVTILHNRLGGLQVLLPGEAKEFVFLKPHPGCAIVNLGDALVLMSGGRLVAGLHRVVRPPGEQGKVMPRASVVYFTRPNNHVKLVSLFEHDLSKASNALTADEWIMRRVSLLTTSNFSSKDEYAKAYTQSRGTEHNSSKYKL